MHFMGQAQIDKIFKYRNIFWYTCPLVPRMAGGSVKIRVLFDLKMVIGGENEDV